MRNCELYAESMQENFLAETDQKLKLIKIVPRDTNLQAH